MMLKEDNGNIIRLKRGKLNKIRICNNKRSYLRIITFFLQRYLYVSFHLYYSGKKAFYFVIDGTFNHARMVLEVSKQ